MEDRSVCKLFKLGYDNNAIQLEISNTQIINNTSLNTAKFIKQIKIEDRTRVVYSKIEGKSLLQEAETCQTPEQMISLLQDLTTLQTVPAVLIVSFSPMPATAVLFHQLHF